MNGQFLHLKLNSSLHCVEGLTFLFWEENNSKRANIKANIRRRDVNGKKKNYINTDQVTDMWKTSMHVIVRCLTVTIKLCKNVKQCKREIIYKRKQIWQITTNDNHYYCTSICFLWQFMVYCAKSDGCG